MRSLFLNFEGAHIFINKNYYTIDRTVGNLAHSLHYKRYEENRAHLFSLVNTRRTMNTIYSYLSNQSVLGFRNRPRYAVCLYIRQIIKRVCKMRSLIGRPGWGSPRC